MKRFKLVLLAALLCLTLNQSQALDFGVGWAMFDDQSTPTLYVTEDFYLTTFMTGDLWFSPSVEFYFGSAWWLQPQFLWDFPWATLSARVKYSSSNELEFRIELLFSLD